MTSSSATTDPEATARSLLPFLKRRWVRSVGIVLAGVIVVAGGFTVDATVFEHRSVQSKVIEVGFRLLNGKASFTDAEQVTDLIEERRRANSEPVPAPTGLSSSVEETTIHGMQTFVIGADGAADQKVVLYLHGGAYINQASSFQFQMADEVARITGARIVIPMYPLAPEHQYDEAYSKLLATYADLAADSDSADLTLLGDSAGGGLALGLAQVLQVNNLPQPENIILLSPWLDLTMTNPGIPNLESTDPVLGTLGLVEMGQAWAGSTETKDPRLSPIYGSFEDLGHITLFTGTRELFIADARKFRAMAAIRSIEITYIEKAKMNHDYPLIPAPEGEEARQQIAQIILGQDIG
ncbi:alpha/beta hydrolase fold domain-containing protein [Cryobacterium sp. AP23]